MPPLEPQENEIALTLGMDTKQSDELAEPTHMRLVENLHWRQGGGIEKRPVHGISATVTAPTDSFYAEDQPACGLIVRGDDVCVVSGQHGVVPYSTTASGFRYMREDTTATSTPGPDLKFAPTSYDVTRKLVHSAQFNASSAGISLVASAQHQGVQVVAWVEHTTSGSSLRMQARDPFSGTTLASVEYRTTSNTLLALDACEYTESGKEGVLIAFVDGAFAPYTIRTYRYDRSTNAFVADSNLTTDAGLAFTIVKNGDRFYFGYHKDSTAVLTVEDRTVGSVSSTHTGLQSAEYGVAVLKGTNRTLIASATQTDAYVEVFGSPGDSATLITASSENFTGITIAREQITGTTDDAVVYVNSVMTSTPAAERVRTTSVNFDATSVSISSTHSVYHCRVVAGGFMLRGRAHAVFAVNGYGVSGATPCIVARFQHGNTTSNKHAPVAALMYDRFFAVPIASFDSLRNGVTVDDSNNAWVTLTGDPATDTIGSTNVLYPQSVFTARISAARPMPMPYASPASGIVMVAGGVPWEFDGESAYEASPLARPKVSVDVSSGTGVTGTYGVIAVYRFVDALGRLHRVASVPTLFTASNDQVDVYVSKCPFRSFDAATSLADMEPELYVTGSGGTEGTVYYLANTSGGSKVTPTTSGGWYKFTDVEPASNSDLELGISVAGGEISPDPTPAFSYVAKVVDRMWAIDAEDRSRVWYSKPLVSGFGVEWSVGNTLVIEDECTAIVDMGGGALVLARGGIYLVSGEGPDATGSVGSFSPAVKFNHTVDCMDPTSVCRTPLGVVFRGRRGFYVFNGQDAVPWAVPIDPEVLTDPSLDPSISNSYRMRTIYQEQTNEIQICGAPGSVGGTSGHRLVYNLFEDKWSRYASTGVDVHDLAVARGKLWALSEISSASVLRDELLYSHSSDAYNSDVATICQISTPWYRLDKVAGVTRLWRAWVAMKLPSDVADISTITLSYYVDDNDVLAQQVTWTGAELAATYGTTGVVASLPFVPMNELQVVRSFRFVLTWANTSASSGPKPLSMRLRFGIRPSLNKRNRLVAKG